MLELIQLLTPNLVLLARHPLSPREFTHLLGSLKSQNQRQRLWSLAMQKLLFLEVPTPLHTKHVKCTISHIKCNLNVTILQWGGRGVADSISASVHICRDCFLL